MYVCCKVKLFVFADVDEDIGWEDDLFEENGGESVPENAEVRFSD